MPFRHHLVTVLTLLFALGAVLVSAMLVPSAPWVGQKLVPGGFRLFRTNPHTTVLLVPEDWPPDAWRGPILVGAKIVELETSDRLIYGYVEDSPFSEVGGVPGYFIVDMQTREVRCGLEKDEFTAEIKARGHLARLRPARVFIHE